MAMVTRNSVFDCVHIAPNFSLPPNGPGSYDRLVWDLVSRNRSGQAVVCKSDGNQSSDNGAKIVPVQSPTRSSTRRIGTLVDSLSGRTHLGTVAAYRSRIAEAAANIPATTYLLWGNSSYLPALRNAIGDRAKIVFAQRHFQPPGGFENLDHADVVVFQTEGALNFALQSMGELRFLPFVIPNGVETGRFTPTTDDCFRDAKQGNINLLFPSTLTEYKGAHFLAEWVANSEKLVGVNWIVPNQFHPSCSPRLRNRLERLLTASQNVEWLNGVSREAMPSLYHRSFATVIPITRQEGFGLVCLESMSSGIPVIACDVPAINEYIENGRTGILVPMSGMLDQLPTVVETLRTDITFYRRLASQAREDVHGNFGREKVLRSFEALIRELRE